MVEISVIIPIYNVENYLNECLDSICNQSFTDIEIICVNDGSTDSSQDILKEYQNRDSRIKIITQENKGVSDARNPGLDIASGKYIYFCDSDDYIDTETLERMYTLSEEKDLDLVIFKLINFNQETGEEDYHYSDMPFLVDIGKEVFSYRDFKDDLFKVDVTVYTKFFKHELIENKRFPEGLIFEDNSFYIDYILDAERIFFLDECLYHKRIRQDSLISRASKNHVDLIEINTIISQIFKDKGIYDEFKEKLFMRQIDSTYYRFELIQEKYKQIYFEAMRKFFLDKKDEFDNDLNMKSIKDYYKNIFNAVINASTPEEVGMNLKLNRLKGKMNSLQRANTKLKNENTKLYMTNHQLLSSNSWRITAPLRKLKRIL